MTSKKSQEEMEQPVKGYQLAEVKIEFKNLKEQVEKGFTQTNRSLETLLIKSESQVTPQQFADNLAAIKNTFEAQLKESEEKIHLEYRPIKKTINWLLLTVAAAAIAIFGQVVFILNLTKGG